MSEQVLNALATSVFAAGVLLWMLGIARGWLPAWWVSNGRMAPWAIGGTDFLLFCLLVFTFTNVAPLLALKLTGFPFDAFDENNRAQLAVTMGMQLGGLAAALLFKIHPAGRADPEDAPLGPALKTAVLAFFISYPVIYGTTFGWQKLLETFDVKAPLQDIVYLMREADGPAEAGLWAALAIVIAPLAEELVFRAGLFRFFAMRMPPMRSALLSSAIFASLHGSLYASVPLIGLGIVLALVYHRTGRLASSILLHAIFNGFTVLGIFLTPSADLPSPP